MTARGLALRGAVALAAAVIVVAATTVLAGSAASPRRAYTSAGNAAAKAIVLKPSDLPNGWKLEKSGGGGGQVTCKGFDPDQSDLTTVGHADVSFARSDGLGNVASLVGIFKSTSQAQASWNRIVRPGMLVCLSSLFENGATDKKTTTTVVSKGRLALSVPGRRAAAFRIVADVATNGQHVKVYLDLIMQGSGRADTVMLVSSVLARPSAVFESKLAAAIAGRLPR
jgi:hypothetical protein